MICAITFIHMSSKTLSYVPTLLNHIGGVRCLLSSKMAYSAVPSAPVKGLLCQVYFNNVPRWELSETTIFYEIGGFCILYFGLLFTLNGLKAASYLLAPYHSGTRQWARFLKICVNRTKLVRNYSNALAVMLIALL